MFLIGGGSGSLASSTDGIGWTVRSSTFGSFTLRSAEWSSELGLFVVVGGGPGNPGGIATSPDGITWTGRSPTGLQTPGGNDVAWSPELGLFVAVGENGGVSTSPDGITWTPHTQGGYTILTVAWSAALGLFIHAGSGGTLKTSPDGSLWTEVSGGVFLPLSTPSIDTENINDVAVGEVTLCGALPSDLLQYYRYYYIAGPISSIAVDSDVPIDISDEGFRGGLYEHDYLPLSVDATNFVGYGGGPPGWVSVVYENAANLNSAYGIDFPEYKNGLLIHTMLVSFPTNGAKSLRLNVDGLFQNYVHTLDHLIANGFVDGLLVDLRVGFWDGVDPPGLPDEMGTVVATRTIFTHSSPLPGDPSIEVVVPVPNGATKAWFWFWFTGDPPFWNMLQQRAYSVQSGQYRGGPVYTGPPNGTLYQTGLIAFTTWLMRVNSEVEGSFAGLRVSGRTPTPALEGWGCETVDMAYDGTFGTNARVAAGSLQVYGQGRLLIEHVDWEVADSTWKVFNLLTSIEGDTLTCCYLIQIDQLRAQPSSPKQLTASTLPGKYSLQSKDIRGV
jgi:hypothetical protein